MSSLGRVIKFNIEATATVTKHPISGEGIWMAKTDKFDVYGYGDTPDIAFSELKENILNPEGQENLIFEKVLEIEPISLEDIEKTAEILSAPEEPVELIETSEKAPVEELRKGELRQLCEEKGVYVQGMTKAEMLEALSE